VIIALDTNVAVAALNRDPKVRDRLANIDAADVLIPAPVVAELMFGARCSARAVENAAKVEALVAAFVVAPFDIHAARLFGAMKAALRRKGTPKQDLDLVIASIAVACGATLVTHDRDLLDGSIEHLVAVDWLAS
jgi:tRNA(fMet)-specific endonuclease VapC